MKIIKRSFRKILGFLGFELNRITEDRIHYANFINLAEIYENLLNSTGNSLQPNETRIRLIARLPGVLPFEAYHIVNALMKCKDVKGDVCEFGVAQGETSALIANEICFMNKSFHLFDSFEGLPAPSEKDKLKDDIFSLGSMEAYSGTMANPENKVHGRLRAVHFPPERYFIHKGFIDKVFQADQNLPKEVSFAFVDFDFYEPIKLTLNYLHGITGEGAIIIVDDYDFFSTGAKTAVDEFLQEKNSDTITYECLVPDNRYGYFAILIKKRSKSNS